MASDAARKDARERSLGVDRALARRELEELVLERAHSLRARADGVADARRGQDGASPDDDRGERQ